MDDLPKDVLRFIAEQIESVPHLEALLLLYRNSAERWTVELVATRLFVSPQKAKEILADLEGRKLIRLRADGSADAYVYDGAWDETGERMETIATTYTRQLARVATFIHAKPPRAVREFARAFEFKKE